LIFTSGATEANNLALLGHARTHGGGHLISVRTEHHAVLDPLAQLQREGFQISLLTPQPDGLITPAQLEEAIRPDTRLVSVMAANNEIGVLQPLKELAEICRDRGVVFIAMQPKPLDTLPLEPDNLGLDLVSLSAHKLYGPKGIGALVIREGLALEPLQWGGGQEAGLAPARCPAP
jgi:cysteine desulfurase